MRPLAALASVAVLICQAAQAGGPFDEQRATFCGAKADSQRLALLESLERVEGRLEAPRVTLPDEAVQLLQSFVHEASKESCEEGWDLGYALGGGYDPGLLYAPLDYDRLRD